MGELKISDNATPVQLRVAADLMELSVVERVENSGSIGLYIYTDGTHDRTVTRVINDSAFEFIDLSVTPDGDLYIYAEQQ